MNITIEQIQGVIYKLPHRKTRLPYTYHHDWLRTNIPVYFNSSRADIGRLKRPVLELWVLALCQIIETLHPYYIAVTPLSDNDREIIRECFKYSANITKQFDTGVLKK